jgi:hypothetical protein
MPSFLFEADSSFSHMTTFCLVLDEFRHCQVSDKAIFVRVTYSSTFFPFSYLTQAIAWF